MKLLELNKILNTQNFYTENDILEEAFEYSGLVYDNLKLGHTIEVDFYLDDYSKWQDVEINSIEFITKNYQYNNCNNGILLRYVYEEIVEELILKSISLMTNFTEIIEKDLLWYNNTLSIFRTKYEPILKKYNFDVVESHLTNHEINPYFSYGNVNLFNTYTITADLLKNKWFIFHPMLDKEIIIRDIEFFDMTETQFEKLFLEIINPFIDFVDKNNNITLIIDESETLKRSISEYKSTNYRVVKTYNEFVNFINLHGLPNKIFFDSPLESMNSNYECALWLIDYCKENKKQLPLYDVIDLNIDMKNKVLDLLKSTTI